RGTAGPARGRCGGHGHAASQRPSWRRWEQNPPGRDRRGRGRCLQGLKRSLIIPPTTLGEGAPIGFESRHYYRDGSYTDRITGLGLEFTPVVKYLIAINVVVFLLQIFVTRPAEFPRPDDAEGGIGLSLAQDDDPPPGTKDEIDPKKREEMERKARRMMERMMSQFPGSRVSI